MLSDASRAAISRTRDTRSARWLTSSVRQRRARRIEEVAEHVHVAALVDRRDLDAGNDADAGALRRRGDLGDRRDGVVIGDADGGEAGGGGARDELGRRQPPVGRRRVHVKIDQR